MIIFTNKKLKKELQETKKTLRKANEANQELRQDCSNYEEMCEKIKEKISKNPCGSVINLQNEMKTILDSYYLNKYRNCK